MQIKLHGTMKMKDILNNKNNYRAFLHVHIAL